MTMLLKPTVLLINFVSSILPLQTQRQQFIEKEVFKGSILQLGTINDAVLYREDSMSTVGSMWTT